MAEHGEAAVLAGVANTPIGTGEAIVTAVLAGYTADSLWNRGVDRFAKRAEGAVKTATEAAS